MSERSIVVGLDSQWRAVRLDVDVLLRTRLLIQANSGGGKSWLLRRLAEQLFGRLPILIVDPEGEFATLRERYGYVLVGQGGETPADVRSAALVAQRLLELRASAVCDLYEMKPGTRHEWVKRFLESLIDAPKKLWQPLIVLVDEAHLFCPEKGAGESPASEAMVALTTRGRKRGFAAVWATQRLAKLRKDAAAELQNVLIGPTFMDADRERAGDALGVARTDRAGFYDEIKLLPEGKFFALGRALSLTRVLVKVGEVLTTHPEPGSTKHAAAPPPPPDKVKALLPKLADLPAEAEAKERTLAEMKSDNARLRRELAEAKRAQPKMPAVEVKRVEVPILKERHLKRLEASIERFCAVGQNMTTLGQIFTEALHRLSNGNKPPPAAPAVRPTVVRVPSGSTLARKPDASGTLTGPEQRILDAIAWMESIGIERPQIEAVAFLAGYRPGGGAFNNPKGALRGRGLIEYDPGVLFLTDVGRGLARAPELALTSEELQRRVLDRLPGPERRILSVLLASYPDNLSYEDLADRSGYASGGGAFNNPRGRLRTLGLVDYPEPGRVVAKPLLFLEER